MFLFFNDGTSLEVGLQNGFDQVFNNKDVVAYQQNGIK